MNHNPRTSGEFKKALDMQRIFPELSNGVYGGLTYRQIAFRIKDFKDKEHPFKHLAVETIVRYVGFALQGFEFEGENYDGLKGTIVDTLAWRRYDVAKTNLNATNQYENWTLEERAFVKDSYAQGIPPKEIWRRYNQTSEFHERTFDSIESAICMMRKNGEINTKQRLNWDSDLGFFAQALVGKYGRDTNYAHKVRTELNNYFFQGEERVTKSIFHNFLKRNNSELERILELK